MVLGHKVSMLVPVLPRGMSGWLCLGCECVYVLDQLMATVLDERFGHQPLGSRNSGDPIRISWSNCSVALQKRT